MKAGRIFWLFGLSGAGKTTLAIGLTAELRAKGHQVLLLDGDTVRVGLSRDLGFSIEARAENIRRVAEVAKMAADQGYIVIAALITPMEQLRELVAQIIGDDRLELVWVDVPLAVCQQRDPKSLYSQAVAGNLPLFTGVGAPFEPARVCNLQLRPESREAMLAVLREFAWRRLG